MLKWHLRMAEVLSLQQQEYAQLTHLLEQQQHLLSQQQLVLAGPPKPSSLLSSTVRGQPLLVEIDNSTRLHPQKSWDGTEQFEPVSAAAGACQAADFGSRLARLTLPGSKGDIAGTATYFVEPSSDSITSLCSERGLLCGGGSSTSSSASGAVDHGAAGCDSGLVRMTLQGGKSSVQPSIAGGSESSSSSRAAGSVGQVVADYDVRLARFLLPGAKDNVDPSAAGSDGTISSPNSRPRQPPVGYDSRLGRITLPGDNIDVDSSAVLESSSSSSSFNTTLPHQQAASVNSMHARHHSPGGQRNVEASATINNEGGISYTEIRALSAGSSASLYCQSGLLSLSHDACNNSPASAYNSRPTRLSGFVGRSSSIEGASSRPSSRIRQQPPAFLPGFLPRSSCGEGNSCSSSASMSGDVMVAGAAGLMVSDEGMSKQSNGSLMQRLKRSTSEIDMSFSGEVTAED